jgi:hypothetical protein
MTVDEVLKAAQSKVGVVEGGGKDGKSGNIVWVWDWWKSVTGRNLQGSPWCAGFVSWCFSQAKASSLIAAENSHGFVSTINGLAYFKKKKQIVDAKEAKPGDVVFFDFDGAGVADHVELVESNDGKILTTIGGNTSPGDSGSQKNGGGCYRRKRTIDKTIIGVGRPSWPALTTTK